MTTTTHVSKSTLDREADARFWAQYHYKIGQKLDPKDPIDQKMIPLWLDIWGKVKREDADGRLVLTYNHPAVERHLDDATIAAHAVDGHLQAAQAEPDPAIAAQHAAQAAQAAQAAAASARGAASAQPPTASPILADAAATQVAAMAGLPPVVPIASSLPPGHPATSSPAAHPIVPPQVASPPWLSDPFALFASHPAQPVPPIAATHPEHPAGHPERPGHEGHHGGHHEHPARPEGPASAMTPEHQIAAAQAVSAPAVAAQVHEDAHARAASGRPPPAGSAHPRATGSVRELAARLANAARSGFVGVDFSSDGQWSAPEFASADEARAWYERAAEHPDRHRYLAHFDRGAGTGAPVDEVFGSSEAHDGADAGGDPDAVAAPSAGEDADRRPSSVPIIAAVAGVGLLALALLAGRGGSSGSGNGGGSYGYGGGRRRMGP